MSTMIPTEIDGAKLGAAARRCVGELLLKAALEARHPAEVALGMATRAFRKVWEVREGEWRPLPVIALSGGRSVASRWWRRQVIEEARARAMVVEG
jgi:hypothetical protein